MQMITDWQHVMKKAWSVRLIAVAGLLSGLELILPMFGADIPRNWYAIATMAVTTLATSSPPLANPPSTQ